MSRVQDSVIETAAGGPRVTAHADAVRVALRAVGDGADLHYGDPAGSPDADRALLDGDARYADALSALADAGDLVAIAELAQTIAMVASARAQGDDVLEAATWQAASAGIGWGPDADLQAARIAVRAGDPAGAQALVAAARQRAANLQTAP